MADARKSTASAQASGGTSMHEMTYRPADAPDAHERVSRNHDRCALPTAVLRSARRAPNGGTPDGSIPASAADRSLGLQTPQPSSADNVERQRADHFGLCLGMRRNANT